jgi:hypothetical protein
MANKQPQVITIDKVEHNVDDLSKKQVMLVNHVTDLDRKIGSTMFQLDQLRVGRDAFMQLLKQELETPTANIVENEQ